jgi:hypothetical protein
LKASAAAVDAKPIAVPETDGGDCDERSDDSFVERALIHDCPFPYDPVVSIDD